MTMRLRKTLFILPNLFTLSNLLCGFLAILMAANATDATGYHRAALLIIFALFFDLLDGRVARLTRTQSNFGVQLDSLSDLVSFGVGPAVLLYQYSLKDLGTLGLIGVFLPVAASAIRLARFNLLTTADDGSPNKPKKYIPGLPAPGAAGVVVCIVASQHTLGTTFITSPWTYLAIAVALSLLMVSTLPFRSFKDVRLTVRSGVLFALALASAATVAVRVHASVALLWLLISYIVIAIGESFVLGAKKIQRIRRQRMSSFPPSAEEQNQP